MFPCEREQPASDLELSLKMTRLDYSITHGLFISHVNTPTLKFHDSNKYTFWIDHSSLLIVSLFEVLLQENNM